MANTRQTLGDQETVDALVSNTLTSLEEDGVTSLPHYALANHSSLTSVNFPNVTYIGQYAFQNCTGLSSVTLPELITIDQRAFDGCTSLTTLDLSATISTIPGTCFQKSGLTHLILRNTSMVTLSDVSAFTGTPIEKYLGAVYVPANLVDTYKANSNWSNYYIASINDYPLQTSPQVLKWGEISSASQNGTYTDYAIGTTIPLTMGSYTAKMELIAKDTDDLADETGKAHMTWLAKDIIFNAKMKNSGNTTCGYTSSDMYTTLANLKSQIDSTIQGYIKPVTKTWKDYGAGETRSSTETFWIPSAREISGGTTYEDSGCDYTSKFSSASNRIKKLNFQYIL